MRPLEFFRNHPVFRYEEFANRHRAAGRKHRTTWSLLFKHVSAGNLINVRRGVYAVVPTGSTPDAVAIDPYLLCSRLVEDAVVAYHAALRFFGRAHSASRRYTYFTSHRLKPFDFKGDEFVPVLVPAPLRKLPDQGGWINTARRQGLDLRVTSLERTLVDVMAAPRHGGGWEEIWRSLESVEYFDLEAVAAYAETLGSAITAARVGYFLEQHREALMVEDEHLAPLEQLRPRQERYFDRGMTTGGTLVHRWNLIVPEQIANRAWEEVA